MDQRVLEASARLLGHESWDHHEDLVGGRGEIAVVWNLGAPCVVKGYDAEKPGAGAREKAALRVLAGAGTAPSWLGEGDDPPYVVMSRLAGSGSLADALMGSSPERAREALLAWAGALAELHDAGTSEVRRSFTVELERRAPHLSARSLPADAAEAADHYSAILEQLGLPPHGDALQALRDLPALLAGEQWEVLSPADACPDNSLIGAHGMHLLDFEFAELRHAAWDVAYLRAPWPSCWCAWRLPDDVADAAVTHYCASRGEPFTGPDFGAALDLATVGWQVMTPAFFIPGALADDDTSRAGRPSRRAFVMHRLRAAARTPVSPALAALAQDVHGALRDLWGGVPLDLAPAFRR